MDKKNHYGEWQEEKNVFGGVRRYRILADGTKEYEQTIITSKYGEVTPSQLKAINKKEAEKKKEPKKEPVPGEEKYCPFKSGNRLLCRKDCAFWSEGGCMSSADTQGKHCPVWKYPCDDKCKLFNGGCSLIRKERKS